MHVARRTSHVSTLHVARRTSHVFCAAYYKIHTVMRPRDFDRVASAPCDLLVIGGTCQGLVMAREAAACGLRTTLIEPLDFGADLSSQHAAIVPGGLHLLRRGRVSAARRAVRARRRLARIAPWLIRPLPFLEPTRRGAPGNRILWRAIFKIDDWVGRHRNDGVEPELHLPAARLVSKAATSRLFPGVRTGGLTGAVQWYDYQILDGDRFAVALAAGAEAAGAELANHVEVVNVRRENDRIAEVNVRDALTGAAATLRCGGIVYAGTAGDKRVEGLLGLPQPTPTIRHVTLATARPASDIALVAARPGGWRVTLLPLHGRAIVDIRLPVGSRSADEPGPNALVTHANDAFPALGLTSRDIIGAQSRFSAAPIDGAAAITDHASGVTSVATTDAASALDAGTRVARRLSKKIGKPLRPPRSEAPLPGGGIADHEALLIETARGANIELPQPVMRHLISRYADQSAAIVKLMAAEARLTRPLSDTHPHVAAEIVHAIRHEKAVRLSDIVARRLGLGASAARVEGVAERVATIAAGELAWDPSRVDAELAAVRSEP